MNEDKETLVFEKIEKILPGYGTIKEKHRKQHTLLFVLSYDEKSQSIKVEINRRSFGSRYELKTYLGISMLVMAREDIFAHKIVRDKSDDLHHPAALRAVNFIDLIDFTKRLERDVSRILFPHAEAAGAVIYLAPRLLAGTSGLPAPGRAIL